MRATPALLVALTLLLAGCAGPDAEPTAQSPGPDPDRPAPTTTAPTTTAPSTAPTPTTDLLAWQPVPGPTDVTVTTNGPWSLAYDEARGRATLTGPDGEVTDPAEGRVSDALLDDDWAVVVHQDPREKDPATAVVTDLSTGTTATLDGATAGAPTLSDGTWALDGDRAAYATRGADGAYCLAEADLAAGSSNVVWCADDRQGFNAAHLSEDGDSVLVFDDAEPACRTVATVDATGITPYADVTPCQGFDGALAADGAVWSEVPDPERIEAATIHARVEGASYDLGAGTSGTLTRCGDAAYFVRDPQSKAEPARLMRWRDQTLSVVFESQAGQAFLAAPRCAGSVLTVSSFAEGGDDQVSATVTG